MILILLFIIGLVVGSFLNVCIYRIPRNESIVFPASKCPLCQHQLFPFDLIPVLSYFFLRGQCRYCHGKIAWRYPAVELLTAGAFLVVGSLFPPRVFPLDFMFSLLFVAWLIVIAFIDLDLMLIPDFLSLSGVFIGLLYNLLKGNLIPALLGLTLGYVFILLVGGFGKIIFKKDAMGEGDLYLAAFMGAFLGWKLMLVALFLSYLFAAGVLGVLLLMKRVKFGAQVPFGPALAVGGVVALWWGSKIIDWYIRLLI